MGVYLPVERKPYGRRKRRINGTNGNAALLPPLAHVDDVAPLTPFQLAQAGVRQITIPALGGRARAVYLICPNCGAHRRKLYVLDDGVGGHRIGCRGCGHLLYCSQYELRRPCTYERIRELFARADRAKTRRERRRLRERAEVALAAYEARSGVHLAARDQAITRAAEHLQSSG
jgi:hypothetical protein